MKYILIGFIMYSTSSWQGTRIRTETHINQVNVGTFFSYESCQKQGEFYKNQMILRTGGRDFRDKEVDFTCIALY